MKSLSYDLSLPSSKKRKCKFSQRCSYYSNANYTCTHMGGKYCGNYRELTSKKPEPNAAYQIA